MPVSPLCPPPFRCVSKQLLLLLVRSEAVALTKCQSKRSRAVRRELRALLDSTLSPGGDVPHQL